LDKYQNPDIVESVSVSGLGLPVKSLKAQNDFPTAEGISVHSVRVPFRAEMHIRAEFGVPWSQSLHILPLELYVAFRLSHTDI
jgi:hypothetical protein